MSNRLGLVILPFIGSLVIRFLSLTMRKTYVGFDEYRKILDDGKGVILAFWHGRLLMMPYAYFRKNRITILVSQSKDGELISRTVKNFGIDSVRGSSTRGWITGVKGLLKAIKDGRDAAITPDGPKGPRMKAQMGVVQMARATGLPIVPLSFGALKKKPFQAGIRS